MLKAVPGNASLPCCIPCFRDPDYLVYGREDPVDALGGYEPNPVARWIDGVPGITRPRRCRRL